jgi:peroxiredoxin Q/BCP
MTNQKAPDFCLLDQEGVTRSLDDYAGRWLVVYFYPHDRSLNCTREACTFRDEYRIISQFGNAQIIGINKGTVESHKDFADKNHLNFPILSDPGHKVTSAYGAWRSSAAKLYDRPFGTRRNTYIINPEGFIVKTYENVAPSDHVAQIIEDLQLLQSTTPSPASA